MGGSRVTPVNVPFAVVWGLINAALLGWLWWGSGDPWGDRGIMLVFALVEGIAVFHTKKGTWRGQEVSLRDTMSEIMTWFARFSKSTARWYQGFNAVVVVLSLHWGWLVGRQLPTWWAGLIVGGFIGIGFLVFHFLRPDKVG